MDMRSSSAAARAGAGADDDPPKPSPSFPPIKNELLVLLQQALTLRAGIDMSVSLLELASGHGGVDYPSAIGDEFYKTRKQALEERKELLDTAVEFIQKHLEKFDQDLKTNKKKQEEKKKEIRKNEQQENKI